MEMIQAHSIVHYLGAIRQHVRGCRRLGLAEEKIEAFVREVLRNDPVARRGGGDPQDFGTIPEEKTER